MLKLVVPATELYDEANSCFTQTKETTISLEHSLVSLSKWESKWHKPFLNQKDRSLEESIDYIRCMTITQNVSPNIYLAFTPELIQKVSEYIDDPMTATWFSDRNSRSRPSREVITSELIYYWMITCGIPFECEKWHINRLLTLIRVCNEKNAPSKKMSKRDMMTQQRALNAARRRSLGTRG